MARTCCPATFPTMASKRTSLRPSSGVEPDRDVVHITIEVAAQAKDGLIGAAATETVRRITRTFKERHPGVEADVRVRRGRVAAEPQHQEGQPVAVIRNELRKNEQGEPEVWANLGDILDWLDTLVSQAVVPAAAGVTLEIKNALLEQFSNATVVRRG